MREIYLYKYISTYMFMGGCVYVCVLFKCICLLLRLHVARRVDCDSLSTSAEGGVGVDVGAGINCAKCGNAEDSYETGFC